MSNSSEQIFCPNCQISIDISKVLYNQIFIKTNAEFLKQKQEFEKEMQIKKQKQEQFEIELQKQKQEQEKIIAYQVNEKLSMERQNLEKELFLEKQNFQKEFERKFLNEHENEKKVMQEELIKKSEELGQLLGLKAENERLKREQKENEERIKFEAKQQALKEFEQTQLQKFELQKQQIEFEFESKKNEDELKFKQLQLQFHNVCKELEKAKEKADQVSQQLQGEIGELIIEEYLKKEFVSDLVQEVPKGTKGADCLHSVYNSFGVLCGNILYESKRTKEFKKEWIEKLKLDLLHSRCDMAVLVTKTMPRDNEKTHFKDGILVCNFKDFKNVVYVLREMMFAIYKVQSASYNKEQKNHILYEYLNSQEFSIQMSLLLNTYKTMREELEAEMRAVQNIWKKRQKQLESLSSSSNSIVTSLNLIFNDLNGKTLIGEDAMKQLENLSKDEENKL
ncbi:DUF2130 domain-containing protein [Campylobacter sp. MIT 21-1685]|uniref:DUF2130 domain-containing protein n=1 Tax=unclassified Campylobacter TaxID=2593542 RepID=UPI00224AEA80|nr:MULTISPECIES: DUF2130 domain-containing protein [unclassified Campylobacter]MCX2683365.1 DUF2130 domain-containing protein [Campylobacter sp. MIT 21-1684]MCX2751580.1 DUF2130 domain-containing protein [Campylobacter sp. MIT 21-1682]MCX2807779.1 DUF2130 domain-containing protein [Campylobacter sp. MIT 21-1685]